MGVEAVDLGQEVDELFIGDPKSNLSPNELRKTKIEVRRLVGTAMRRFLEGADLHYLSEDGTHTPLLLGLDLGVKTLRVVLSENRQDGAGYRLAIGLRDVEEGKSLLVELPTIQSAVDNDLVALLAGKGFTSNHFETLSKLCTIASSPRANLV